MRIIDNNYSLTRDYKPWGGAEAVVGRMTYEELTSIEKMLDEINEEPIEITKLNDFFWFDDEIWLEWLNTTEDEFYARPIYKPYKF